jgi:hypothetical protein
MVEKTFEAQENLVNNVIILTVMKSLDMKTFPVSESIVREMIHSRHKHQREEHKLKQKTPVELDKHYRKKHLTSRRNESV